MSSVAVRGKSPEAVRSEIRVRQTGPRQEVPEAPLTGTDLPGGWYLVVANHAFPPFLREPGLPRLSSGCEVVFCFVEEHVMASSAALWQDGRRVWSIDHDAQQGAEHMEVRGDLPPVYASIRDHLCSLQSAARGSEPRVDYLFDIPVELARTYTDYRYDSSAGGPDVRPFEVLELVSHRERLARWFRRLRGR